MTARRRAQPLLLTLLPALGVLLVLWSAGQAQAAGYRYWSFWERDGARWTYATQGPATARPADGAVEGFRFAVSEDSGDASRPRGAAGFSTICAGTDAVRGKKRVALVLDFGTPADAPSGEKPPARRTACAVVSGDATSAEALAAVAKPLRYDTNALLCAIAGYPAKGCGEQVTATAGGKPDSEPSVGLLTGAGVVVLLAAGAFWQARRRKNA
ncbi:SCO2322 family protein [Streptomyces humi]